MSISPPAKTPTRHPELVSGSIAPHSRSVVLNPNGAVVRPNDASARAEKWTLKQVQGDEIFEGSAR